MDLIINEKNNGVAFDIKVQPRASKNAIGPIFDGKLKVSLTSPPVDGKANKDCIAFLAKTFDVSKSSVSILHGETGRIKTIHIQGISVGEFTAKLKEIK